MTDPIAQVEAVLADTTGGRDIVVALAVMPEALAVVRAAEAAVVELRTYHRPGKPAHPNECVTCRQTWPCTVEEAAASMADALSAFTERVQSALGEEGS